MFGILSHLSLKDLNSVFKGLHLVVRAGETYGRKSQT
jgi:hypothetical protein